MAHPLTLAWGVLVGIVANIGLGPVTIYAVTRRLRFGVRAGMEVGLACSALDAVYCFLAAEAAGFLAALTSRYSRALSIAGSLVLLVVAGGLLRQSRRLNESALLEGRGRGGTSAVASTVLLFLTNPLIPVFWLTVAGYALTYGWLVRGTAPALLFAFGCGLGGVVRYVVLMRYILKSAERIKIGVLKAAIVVLALVLVAIAAYGLLGTLLGGPSPEALRPGP